VFEQFSPYFAEVNFVPAKQSDRWTIYCRRNYQLLVYLIKLNYFY